MSRALVAAVSILILFIWITFWVTVAIPWLWWTTSLGFFNILLLHFYLVMIYYNYYLSIVTPPGSVPKGWIPDGATEEELMKAKRTPYDPQSAEKVIHCHTCQEFKPPRAHHCRTCNRCVLKLEHHCPWINNCVGHFNHKYFILFVFYASLALGHCFVLFMWRVLEIAIGGEAVSALTYCLIQVYVPHMILLVVCYSFTFPVGASVMYIFFFQLNILLTNTTSVEVSKKKWQAFDARKANKTYRWAYDYGTLGNIEFVMGKFGLGWFLPIPTKADGIHWPTRSKGEPEQMV